MPLRVTSTASEAFQSLSSTCEASALAASASLAVGGAVVSPLLPASATVAVAAACLEEARPEEPQAPSASAPTRAIAPIVRAGVMIFFRAFIVCLFLHSIGLVSWQRGSGRQRLGRIARLGRAAQAAAARGEGRVAARSITYSGK